VERHWCKGCACGQQLPGLCGWTAGSEWRSESLVSSIVLWKAYSQNRTSLSLHVPHTDETKGLIGQRELSMMKPTVFPGQYGARGRGG
jgi:hypothetical protein